ncbi:MAG: hypothetical protein CM15mP14_3450 [Rhodospirillaceae bacterium]|nr:MAG: hypothetical protein CM15mP14_3450 [Rhodospirillaceae bacterium]
MGLHSLNNTPYKKINSELKFVYSENDTLSKIFSRVMRFTGALLVSSIIIKEPPKKFSDTNIFSQRKFSILEKRQLKKRMN